MSGLNEFEFWIGSNSFFLSFLYKFGCFFHNEDIYVDIVYYRLILFWRRVCQGFQFHKQVKPMELVINVLMVTNKRKCNFKNNMRNCWGNVVDQAP